MGNNFFNELGVLLLHKDVNVHVLAFSYFYHEVILKVKRCLDCFIVILERVYVELERQRGEPFGIE